MNMFLKRLKAFAKKISKQVSSLNTREMRMAGALTIVVLVSMTLAITTVVHRDSAAAIPEERRDDVVAVFHHPFTGAVLDSAWQGSVYVFGVMVENSYDAWPLSGVEDAFLVIEAPVEGSIPRFLTFFTSDMNTKEIGPVRSARPYYVEWATAWKLIYHHVGGSPEALDLIHSLGTQDVDEFFDGPTFWRSGKRYAPHNAYTSIERMTQHADDKSYPKQTEGFFSFASMDEGGDAKQIHITWFDSPSAYDVGWTLESGKYVRSQGDKVALSADGDRYVFDNVVVMETDVRSVDEKDRKHMRTTGEGKAWIFENGHQIEGTWKRENQLSALKFYDIWGKEITFMPVKTWITVVEDMNHVSVSQ